MNLGRGGWLILLTIIVAFLLTIVRAPLNAPDWLGLFRPGWIALVVLFWAMHVPHRIGLIATWCLGLFVDILYADPLGLNGMVLATATFFVWRFQERLRIYRVPQQALVAAMLVLFCEAARRLAHGQAEHWLLMTLAPAAVSMVLWPAVNGVMWNLKQRFRVE